MPIGAPRPIHFRVNNKAVSISIDGRTPLLYILRNDLALNGPKYGCGLGECGACCVLVDGRLARSCIVPLQAVAGREVVTLEGLSDGNEPGPVQAAFVQEQAAQCGYCLNGMIVTAHAFLASNPEPTDEQIAHALRFNLCRCGTHVEIMRAVRTAAKLLREQRR
jgi:nicotinate dehydrogenase subunit A